MKKLFLFACLFAVSLCASGKPSIEDAQNLARVKRYFGNCVWALGETGRSRCEDEQQALVACIQENQDRREEWIQANRRGRDSGVPFDDPAYYNQLEQLFSNETYYHRRACVNVFLGGVAFFGSAAAVHFHHLAKK